MVTDTVLRNDRHWSLCRLRTDTGSWRPVLHLDKLLYNVIPGLVYRHWYYRSRRMASNEGLNYEHVRMAIRLQKPGLCNGLAVLV